MYNFSMTKNPSPFARARKEGGSMSVAAVDLGHVATGIYESLQIDTPKPILVRANSLTMTDQSGEYTLLVLDRDDTRIASIRIILGLPEHIIDPLDIDVDFFVSGEGETERTIGTVGPRRDQPTIIFHDAQRLPQHAEIADQVGQNIEIPMEEGKVYIVGKIEHKTSSEGLSADFLVPMAATMRRSQQADDLQQDLLAIKSTTQVKDVAHIV